MVSRTAEHVVNNIVNRELRPIKARDGDIIDLGGKTLQFIWAPFLHWPDTMFTYLVEEKILFPCDAFGCHFCDDRLFNNLVDDFSDQFRYYYQSLMRPFKGKVLEAVAKIRELEIDIICPSHGPILRADPWRYIDSYAEWSRMPEAEGKRALILYASAYGNTKRMAERIAEGIAHEGLGVELFDATQIEIEDLLDRIEAADALIVGSLTINGDTVKPIWDLLSSLATIKVKGKVGAAFGSYGWSGEAVGIIEARLKSLRLKIPEPGLKYALVPTEEELEECREFGRRLAKAL